jgi:hypothetical protein
MEPISAIFGSTSWVLMWMLISLIYALLAVDPSSSLCSRVIVYLVCVCVCVCAATASCFISTAPRNLLCDVISTHSSCSYLQGEIACRYALSWRLEMNYSPQVLFLTFSCHSQYLNAGDCVEIYSSDTFLMDQPVVWQMTGILIDSHAPCTDVKQLTSRRYTSRGLDQYQHQWLPHSLAVK